MKVTPLTWLASLILCIGIGASYKLDAPDDHSAEWAQSAALQDAQRAAALLSKKEQSAQALCRQERGEALASFDADGALVCTPKRGPAVRVAMGGTDATQTPALGAGQFVKAIQITGAEDARAGLQKAKP